MANLVYKRVSTDRQNLVLGEAGIEDPVPFEVEAGDSSRLHPLQRPKFSDLLTYARPGDTVHISEMFRLVRGTQHILDVLDVLHTGRLALRIHDGAFSAMDLTARGLARDHHVSRGAIRTAVADLMPEHTTAGSEDDPAPELPVVLDVRPTAALAEPHPPRAPPGPLPIRRAPARRTPPHPPPRRLRPGPGPGPDDASCPARICRTGSHGSTTAGTGPGGRPR